MQLAELLFEEPVNYDMVVGRGLAPAGSFVQQNIIH